MPKSPYVVYVDESGDPGLNSFDARYPVFCLCASLYKTEDYLEVECPEFSKIKFSHWWHDAIVFHGYKIRKKTEEFLALRDNDNFSRFMDSLDSFFRSSQALIIAAAINKPRHLQQYANPVHPYDLALEFVMERSFLHLNPLPGGRDTTVFVFEKRGKSEDALLKRKFDEIAGGQNRFSRRLPFLARFARKEANVVGLQVADLAAYPIARYVETGDEDRRDWKAVSTRIRRSFNDVILGYGIKVFP